MAFLSRLRTRQNAGKGSTPSVAHVIKKRQGKRKILGAFCALTLLLILPLVISQWNIYRANLAVKNQNWPQIPPMKKSDRLLIIAPHCDDETLGAGGTIAAARQSGASVRVIFLTNGDGSRATRYVVQAREWKAKINSAPTPRTSANLFQRIAAMRQEEAIAACAKLGVAKKEVFFLGFPDGGLRAMWETNWENNNSFVSPTTNSSRSPYANSFTPNAAYSGAHVTRDLEKIFREYKPTVILTTHPEDTHGDHWAAFAYSSATLEKLRLSDEESTRRDASRSRLMGFLVHRGIWPTPNGYHPQKNLWPPASLVKSDTKWQIATLSPGAQKSKKSALESYSSQLATTPRYLRAFVRGNELFGGLSKSQKVIDPPSDSAWSEAWRAADIQNMQFQTTPKTLTIKTVLTGAPSSRVCYRYALHLISSKQISVWKIEARQRGTSVQATSEKLSQNQQSNNRISNPNVLKANLTADGLSFELPRQMLELQNKSATILISAATFAGAKRLDQTATTAFSSAAFSDESFGLK